jgi:superfamily I DNA and/or RNA helicase
MARSALHTVERVAVLAPYRGQVHLLTALVRDLKLRDRVTVGTIHRMQGAEAPAVIFDIVVQRLATRLVHLIPSTPSLTRPSAGRWRKPMV